MYRGNQYISHQQIPNVKIADHKEEFKLLLTSPVEYIDSSGFLELWIIYSL